MTARCCPDMEDKTMSRRLEGKFRLTDEGAMRGLFESKAETRAREARRQRWESSS
jgi:hypothetical protein